MGYTCCLVPLWRLSRLLPLVLAGLLAAPAPGEAQARKAAAAVSPLAAAAASLVEARRLYNMGRYDEAVAAASQAREVTAFRPAALLIEGRAELERFRQTGEAVQLVRGREALRAIDASSLEPRDRAELAVGLGLALYLAEAYRPAALVFESALEQATLLGPGARDQVLDWWGSAIDRDAQSRPEPDRLAAYRRLRETMAAELRRDPGAGTASYWVAAAARATGDLDGAYEAAMAGWVRALLTRDRGASLRPDLDQLVIQGIIPERARRQMQADETLEQAIARLAGEWERFKERWTDVQ
ncbi:MAG: hypothetical protein KJ066_16575 [Acidobacteria bacterium]|nr:hypothetical protein [Acidobacteriota bacterium]